MKPAKRRLHGARGGAPEDSRQGQYKHSERTRTAVTTRMQVNDLVRHAREVIADTFAFDQCSAVDFMQEQLLIRC